MIEINLLPDIKQQFIRAQRLKKLIITLMILIIAAALAIVLLLVFYVYIAQPVRQKFADDSIKKYAQQLKGNKDLTRDLTLQQQLSTITPLHEDKGSYDRLIDYLKTLNPQAPNNISISKAQLDSEAGTISLEASAKNFQAIAIFNDTVKNAKLQYSDSSGDQKIPLFSSVVVSDTSLGQDSSGQQVAAFKALLTYDPAAFDWTVTDPIVTIPNENTTPSAKRVSVFADKPLKEPSKP